MLRFSFIVLCVISFQAMGAATGSEQPAGTVVNVRGCGCFPWLSRSSRVPISTTTGGCGISSLQSLEPTVTIKDIYSVDFFSGKWSIASSESIIETRPKTRRSLSEKVSLSYVWACVACVKALKEESATPIYVHSLVEDLVDSMLSLDDKQKDWLISNIFSRVMAEDIGFDAYSADKVLGGKDLPNCTAQALVARPEKTEILYKSFVVLLFTIIQSDKAITKECLYDHINSLKLPWVPLNLEFKRCIVKALQSLFQDTDRQNLVEYVLNEISRSISSRASPLETPYPVDPVDSSAAARPADTGAGVGL